MSKPDPARLTLMLLAAALVFACVVDAQGARGANRAWVGSWATAPQPAMPGEPLTFRNQTLRLIAHVSIGGRSLRIRLSNAYGQSPLVLGRVHVALRSSGAAINSASGRFVTFDGAPTATIAPGQSLQSDRVSLVVPAFSDVAVSLYLPQASTPATTNHFMALQTGYVASQPGDHAGENVFNVGSSISSWPFLTGVEVDAPQAAGAVVVFGDSTVDGDGSSDGTNHRWPDALAVALNRRPGARPLGVLNYGIIGSRLLQPSPREPPSTVGDAFGEAGVQRFERDIRASAASKWVIVRLGINDIGFPGSLVPADRMVSAGDLVAGYRTLIRNAHRHRIRIIGTTLGPFEGAGYYTPAKEAIRRAVNSWIRDGGEFDAVIDIDALLRDPAHPSRLAPAFDSGDHLHPNDVGNSASADAVPLSPFGVGY